MSKHDGGDNTAEEILEPIRRNRKASQDRNADTPRDTSTSGYDEDFTRESDRMCHSYFAQDRAK
jgi:hypothetical protein